mgnify:FL=1
MPKANYFLIKNNENGKLVNPDSVIEFVDSIKQVISSPEQSNKLINEARVFAEKLDWSIVEKLWIKVLD